MRTRNGKYSSSDDRVLYLILFMNTCARKNLFRINTSLFNISLKGDLPFLFVAYIFYDYFGEATFIAFSASNAFLGPSFFNTRLDR